MFVLLCLCICFILYLLSKDKSYIVIAIGMLFSLAYIYFFNWTYSSYLRRAAIFMYVLYLMLYGKKKISRKEGE